MVENCDPTQHTRLRRTTQLPSRYQHDAPETKQRTDTRKELQANTTSPLQDANKTTLLLYCTCRTEWEDGVEYLGCDFCEEWFHYRCVGIPTKLTGKVEQYRCMKCCAKGAQKTPADALLKKEEANRNIKLEEKILQMTAEIKELRKKIQDDKLEVESKEKQCSEQLIQIEKNADKPGLFV